MPLSRFARRFALALLALPLLFTLTTHAQDSGDTPPADPRLDAATAYLTALLAGDLDAAAPLMCEADSAILTPRGIADLWSAVADLPATFDFPADLDGVVLSLTQAGEDWAQISVSGALLVTLDETEEPLAVMPRTLGIQTLWVVQDADSWRGCLTAPPGVDPMSGPAEVVREFLDAAFSVDYDRAQATLCAAQQGALSEAEFIAIYQPVAAEGVTLDFSRTIFTVTAWDDTSAEVTLSGEFRVTMPNRPGGADLPVGELEYEPVPLVFENGWKICQIAAEQVEP